MQPIRKCIPRRYDLNETESSNKVYEVMPNNNHSQFIFFDNGCIRSKAWDGVDDFITNFCTHLAKGRRKKSTILSILIGGDVEELKILKSRLEMKQLCLVLLHTGLATTLVGIALSFSESKRYARVISTKEQINIDRVTVVGDECLMKDTS